MVLAVANFEGMLIHQLDVKTAFLNGKLDQEIYMRLPNEFETKGLVAKLQRSLYGLKQASRAWNSRFHEFVTGLGFVQSKADSCLYTAVKNGELVLLIIYVDDILIACRSLELISTLKDGLKREFEMTDLNEVKTFLGLSVEYDRAAGAQQYLESLLNRFNMGECKPTRTPIATGLKLTKCTDKAEQTDKPYRELIGCLMYATTTSRPDLSAAVNYFSGFQSCASEEHWSHLKRVLRYIRGTLGAKLVFRRSGECKLLQGYVDADCAEDVSDRRSTSGFLFYVYGCLVSWASRKQTSVALSSAEAEYVALSVGATEAIWLRMVLQDLHRTLDEPTDILEDNQACIRVAEEEKPTKRLKHVDVRWHFIRTEIQRGVIKLSYVPTNLQVADIMTKALPGPQFANLRDKLGLSA
ncbi:hypothetical protein RP20_CCG018696 [Aedes albopictus]|nr:hypothetical protein RP20_CCG018696 [Aedes albopictus]